MKNVNVPCISTFQVVLDNPVEIHASEVALSLIQTAYHRDYYNSSISHHHFVRIAPTAIQNELSKFVWSTSVLKQIRAEFKRGDGEDDDTANNRGMRVIPDVFDEVYLMRPESDLLDEKKVHFDGNLKIPGTCTIRALTYLSGKDATLFALTSERNYTTRNHTSIVLDFDRELHYVSLQRDPESKRSLKEPSETANNMHPEPRVMIKSALHVVRPGENLLLVYFHIGLHRIMVFAARSFRRAFESKSHSDSDSNLPSKSEFCMMAVDNTIRFLNKIHMILPLLVIGIPLGAICLASLLNPVEFSPYVFHITVRCLYHRNQVIQRGMCWAVTALVVVAMFAYKSRIFESDKLKKNVKSARRPSASTVATAADTHINKPPSYLVPALVRVGGLRSVILHTAWVGLCYYFEVNAGMANDILLAPWQQSIYFDDLQ
eukprot:jgi/Psemu1/41538/gm1.41538_g